MILFVDCIFSNQHKKPELRNAPSKESLRVDPHGRIAAHLQEEGQLTPPPNNALNMLAALLRDALLYFILPLWLVAGFTDYVLHRLTQIEQTAGIKESLLHVLQLSEVGVPVLLGLLFDINSLIILIMLLALMAHEATALYDVSYALPRRYVGVLEQHVHSFMEVLPFLAILLVVILNWDQFLALFGIGIPAHVLSCD